MVPGSSDLDDRGMVPTANHKSDAKLALLASLAMFRKWSKDELVALGRQVELCEVPVGTVLQRQGEPVSQWLHVVEGAVLRLRHQVPVALLPAGSSWGGPLVAPGGPGRPPSPETLVALEPATVLVADSRRWRVLVADHPSLSSPADAPTHDYKDDLTPVVPATVVSR